MGDERDSDQILKSKMSSKKTGSHFAKRVSTLKGCWYYMIQITIWLSLSDNTGGGIADDQ
jgi:hypothetical protein